ncbi:hypothetical protein [Mycolicibacterium sp. CBMA 234]|uniref:hypothetical protein n=1 Tax=Mycolicibacterium sp. CBMA 234 TaxID=1918495 RepID=UPI0012DCC9ED|nr:hypothetical protein [Mycolicibacterium sp. CBMA 234]
MLSTVCRVGASGITVVGAGALLFVGTVSPAATPAQPVVAEIIPTAFGFSQLLPFAVPGIPSAGAVAVAALLDNTGAVALAALQTVNQLGPLAANLDSLRSFSVNQPPPGSHSATVNYTDMDQWLTGVPGLASTTGVLGFVENAAAYGPFIGTHAGVLQLANQVGPVFFDLNVLKAIGFTQAPDGQVLMNGRPDNFSAVDIGRWNAGIAGVITNSGTTGFVTYQDFGGGPVTDYRVAGLHTTTQVGSMTFDFKFLPSFSTGIFPGSFSFAMAPDMTAANTPFAGSTPPTPGVIQPNGGLPVPVAATPAPAARVAATTPTPPSAPVQAAARTSTADDPAADTSATAPDAKAVKPKPVIPGVNGAPLAAPGTTASPSGGGGGNPFKPFATAIQNGLSALTGGRTGTSSGTGSAGGSDSGGAAGGH